MSVRAVIFDVYKTLLAVAPPPADREAGWTELTRAAFGAPAGVTLAGFVAAAETAIAREHAAARAAGIAFPEIYWPDIATEVLPELRALAPAAQADFLLAQKALLHRVSLLPGAVEALAQLRAAGVPLGLASNAQPYTLRELARALAPAGAGLAWFEPDLCFWSFAHGFSKPDPHVFRLLTARLRARGVAPAEALMVGDRLDNDIAPARAQGWATWHLGAAAGPDAGDWARFAEWVGRRR